MSKLNFFPIEIWLQWFQHLHHRGVLFQKEPAQPQFSARDAIPIRKLNLQLICCLVCLRHVPALLPMNHQSFPGACDRRGQGRLNLRTVSVIETVKIILPEWLGELKEQNNFLASILNPSFPRKVVTKGKRQQVRPCNSCLALLHHMSASWN